MFLRLEDNGVILMENVVALVRRDGKTAITLRKGPERESSLTPAAIARKSARLTPGMAWKYGYGG